MAGAVVRATALVKSQVRPAHGLTDAAGSYALELPAPAVALDVYAEGYLPLVGVENGRSNGRVELFVEGSGPWERDFTLRPAAVLTGTVSDRAGRPVGNGVVYVIAPDRALLDVRHVGNVVVTDEQGRYSFPDLPAGLTDVGVRAQGVLPALRRDVRIPDRGRAVLDLVLERGRSVEVRVDGVRLDPSGSSEDTVRVLASDSRLRSVQLPPGGLEELIVGLPGRAFVEHAV
ncbi:MAG: carboxypeptidase-like regulatory domain-containing protein, partial [Planctomycetota bacterium]